MRRSARCIVAALLIASPASAQMAAGTRSVAMGGGGMVFATGVEAVEWNPANLAWAGGWNISLFELGAVGLGDGATVADFQDMLGDDDAAAQAALGRLPASGFRLSTVSEGFATSRGAEEAGVPQPGSPLPTIGVAFGPVAFRVRSRVFADATLSKEILDLIALGFEEERLQDYAVGNTAYRSVSLTEYTLSYGFEVGALAIGVGGRYVQGHTLLDGRFFEPEIDINNQTLLVRSVAVESQSGTGYGLDVGLSLELPGGFRLAGSGSNIVQQMDWDDNLVAWTAEFDDQDFDNYDVEDFFNEFQQQAIDPTGVSLAVFEAGSELFSGSYFPQTYRGGLGWQSGGTSLEAVGVLVSPRGRFSSPWDERVSFGLEQKIPVLTLRGGYAIAQEGLSTYTAGVALRLGPVHIEGSAGKFNGERDVGAWDGYYGSVGLQIKGGGL
jgi:hypothetical protein